MKTFTWRTFAARDGKVEAHRVSFEPSGHVAFWEDMGALQDRLVLAVRAEDCNNLREIPWG